MYVTEGAREKLLADMGAYLQLVTPGIPLLGGVPQPGHRVAADLRGDA